jgi:DNA-binding response OmpR family regulator
MEPNSNNGGLLPSAMALKDSLNPQAATSPEQMMLTPYQQELLRRLESEIDEYLARSAWLDALLARVKATARNADV